MADTNPNYGGQPIPPSVGQSPIPGTAQRPPPADIQSKPAQIESGTTPVTSLTETRKENNSGRSGMCKGSGATKYDYFGKPIREKFPYYPYGIIKPRCHGPSLDNARGMRKAWQDEVRKSEEDACKEFLCKLLKDVLSKAAASLEEELEQEEINEKFLTL